MNQISRSPCENDTENGATPAGPIELWHQTFHELLDGIARSTDPFGMTAPIVHAQLAWAAHPKELSDRLVSLSSDLWRLQQHTLKRLFGLPDTDPIPVTEGDARFADPAMDESALAAQGAAKLGMPNTAVAMPDDVAADFAQIVADLDEPFADPSSFPTWYLARETTRRVKVVLCGDGGDELFGGYKRYRQHLRSAWRLRLPLAPFPGRPAGILPTRRRRLAAELAMSWRDAYALRFSGFGPLERRALQPGFAVAGQYWRGEADGARSPLEQLLAIDHANYLPEYVLRKADLMTMAHGLEARPPLLDHRFVECVLGLPAARRFTHPAKRALAPFCPPCVELGLFARKKRGFNPPLERLVRTDLGERLGGLGASLAHASAGQIAAAPVETLVRAYENDDSLAEKMLQLLMLDESLRQLAELARAAP